MLQYTITFYGVRTGDHSSPQLSIDLTEFAGSSAGVGEILNCLCSPIDQGLNISTSLTAQKCTVTENHWHIYRTCMESNDTPHKIAIIVIVILRGITFSHKLGFRRLVYFLGKLLESLSLYPRSVTLVGSLNSHYWKRRFINAQMDNDKIHWPEKFQGTLEKIWAKRMNFKLSLTSLICSCLLKVIFIRLKWFRPCC